MNLSVWLRQDRDAKTGEFTSGGGSDTDEPAISGVVGATADGREVSEVKTVGGSSVNAGKMFFMDIDGKGQFVKFSSPKDQAREAGARVVNDALNGLVTMPGATRVEFDDLEGDAAKFGGKTGLVVDLVSGDTIGPGGKQETRDDNSFADESKVGDEELRSLALFDAVIGNVDRHNGQAMITDDKEFASVDHGASFHDNSYRGNGGNYFQYSALESRDLGSDLPLDAESRLLSLIDSREEVSEGLSAAGLTDSAIDSVFARAQALLAEGRLPSSLQEFIKTNGDGGFRTSFSRHLLELAMHMT